MRQEGGKNMEIEDYKKKMKDGEKVVAGSKEHLFMHEMSEEARKITFEINSAYHTKEENEKLFARLIGCKSVQNFMLFPPFFADFGKNIKIGKDVFINSGCCFQDQGGIEIGDGCLIGQQVVLATLNHDLNPNCRGDMIPAPIKIGNRVWIGAHVTVLPGVTIGDNSVVGAGAVVTKDVPPNVVVVGNPARIVKYIVDDVK